MTSPARHGLLVQTLDLAHLRHALVNLLVLRLQVDGLAGLRQLGFRSSLL